MEAAGTEQLDKQLKPAVLRVVHKMSYLRESWRDDNGADTILGRSHVGARELKEEHLWFKTVQFLLLECLRPDAFCCLFWTKSTRSFLVPGTPSPLALFFDSSSAFCIVGGVPIFLLSLESLVSLESYGRSAVCEHVKWMIDVMSSVK